MPSWTDIQQYARSKYTLAEDNEDIFSLVFRLPSERTQKIWVHKFEAFEEDWIEFRSVVCKFDELSPKIALRKNSSLVIGSLALDGDGDYVLLHNAPLATMDMDEFERPLHIIAHTADDLEKDYSEGDDEW